MLFSHVRGKDNKNNNTDMAAIAHADSIIQVSKFFCNYMQLIEHLVYLYMYT